MHKKYVKSWRHFGPALLSPYNEHPVFANATEGVVERLFHWKNQGSAYYLRWKGRRKVVLIRGTSKIATEAVELWINKEWFKQKHCQRHNGPIGWHHNWKYPLASIFSQQVAPQEFIGNSCISTKFGHQTASHALIWNLATRWRHLH